MCVCRHVREGRGLQEGLPVLLLKTNVDACLKRYVFFMANVKAHRQRDDDLGPVSCIPPDPA